jgi:D-alanyl-D-alanine carboxypeptidase (penicillin-binding protein 5/6)
MTAGPTEAPRALSGTRTRVMAASVATLLVLAVAAVVSHHSPGGSGPHGSLSSDGTTESLPAGPQLALAGAAKAVMPGSLPKLPWPATGEAAIGVQGVGTIAATADQASVPIASVTKMMTAYLVLRDHPLSADGGGPDLTMTEADALAYQQAAESDESNLDVVAGEVLDERQLLEGLLIPSADNIADLLAQWDAGSVAAFVAKMNAEAQVLGMTGTHYADPSGLDPASRSTAQDQVQLGSLAMENPAFASIVDNASVRLPVSGQVWNYNPLIGVDGVVGIKSGFTSEASACLVAAAWREVGGQRVLLVSAALGQPNGLYGAAAADRALLDAATPLLQLHQVITTTATVAMARVPWSHSAAGALASSPVSVVAWPGATVTLSVQDSSVKRAWVQQPHGASAGAGETDWTLPAGTEVGSVVVKVAGTAVAAVPLRLSSQIAGPPAGWSGTSG